MVDVSLNGAGVAGLPVLEAAEAGLRVWLKGLLVSRIKLLKATLSSLNRQINFACR